VEDALAVLQRLDQRVDAVLEQADLVRRAEVGAHREVAGAHAAERVGDAGERAGQGLREHERQHDAERDVEDEDHRAGAGQPRDDLGRGGAVLDVPHAGAHQTEHREERQEGDGDEEDQHAAADAEHARPQLREPSRWEDARDDHRAKEPIGQQIDGRRREEAVHQRREDVLRKQLRRPAPGAHECAERKEHRARDPGNEAHE
jgi:hypothetical protein